MQERFKEFAAKAQEAGTRFAAQVKEQQQKMAQRTSQPGGEHIDGRHESAEMETALKLMQIQNKALRDRLRAAADENERLKDQLQQRDNLLHGPDGSIRTSRDSPHISRSESSQATAEEEEEEDETKQLRDQLQTLAELLRRSEERAAAADDLRIQLASMQHELAAVISSKDSAESEVKETHTTLQGMHETISGLRQAHTALEMELSQSAATLEALTKEKKELQDSLERARSAKESVMAAAESRSAETEALSLTVSALETRLAQTPEAPDFSEMSAETESLRAAAHAYESQIAELHSRIENLAQERSAALQERDEALRSDAECAAQLQRMHMEHVIAIESLEEKASALKMQLTDAQADGQAALEAAKEESGWLRDGAAELQRQIEAASVASQQSAREIADLTIALERAGKESAAHQKRIAQLEEQAVRVSTTAPPRASMYSVEGTDATTQTETQCQRVSYDPWTRGDIEVARQEALEAAERALPIADAGRQEAEGEAARLRDELERLQRPTPPLPPYPHPHPSRNPIPRGPCHTEASPSQPALDGGERLGTGGRSVTSPRGVVVGSSSLSLGASPLIPLHRREPSYSSEIEPIVEASPTDGTALVASSPRPAKGGGGGGDACEKSPTSKSVFGGDKEATALISSRTGAGAGTMAVLPDVENESSVHTVAVLQQKIDALLVELRDSEHTHELRDTAAAVLKEEIAELRRQQKRAAVDLEYLTAVLVESFASGELDPGSGMLPVLARLLQFSPADVQRASKGRQSGLHRESGGVGMTSSSAASALFARLTGGTGG